MSKAYQFNCEVCGEEVTRYESQIKRSKTDTWFCGLECRGEYDRSGKLVTCDECGEETYKAEWLIERSDNHFCGKECHDKYQIGKNTGEDHPNWKGGHNFGYGYNWEEQRKKALNRDEYRCQRCKLSQREHENQFGKGLEVHHIEPKESFRDSTGTLNVEEANALSNLVTLCRLCHDKLEGLPIDNRGLSKK